MESYINRRLRDRVMVAGMPAERFMACVGIACIPILIVIFNPLFVCSGFRGELSFFGYSAI